MYYNPVHPHCGPFNSVSRKRPYDEVDAACWAHDKKYAQYGSKAYWKYNKADKEFIDTMQGIGSLPAKFYAMPFKFKRKFFPELEEGPARKRRRYDKDPPTPPPENIGGRNKRQRSFPVNNSMFYRRRYARRRPAVVRRRPAGRGFRRSRQVARRVAGRRVVGRKPVVRRRFVRYGRIGRRGKRFNRRYVNFAGLGSLKRVENGGTVTDAQAVYVGQALAWNELHSSICRALVRALFKMKGEDITNWDNNWLGGVTTLRISYRYGAPLATALTQANYDFPATTSYAALADGLRDSIINAFSNTEQYQIFDMWLNEQVSPAQTQAYLNLSECSFTYYFRSSIKIQNRTLAGTTVVDDEDELANDITNNPLVGRIYMSKKQLTGFLPMTRDRTGTEANYDSYLANANSGLISAINSETLITETVKPPAGYFFGAKSVPLKVKPGQIKSFSIKQMRTMTFKHFYTKYSYFVGTALADTAHQIAIGPALMVGLEKQLDTRTTENPILIGYQIDQTYAACVNKHTPRAAAILDVN